MRTISHDGVRIAFEAVGRGRPLVLLHGFYGDRTTWHLGRKNKSVPTVPPPVVD